MPPQTSRETGSRTKSTRVRGIAQHIPEDHREQERAPALETQSPSGWAIKTWRSALLLSLATVGLNSLIFEPVAWWPVAFVCLVPWLLLIGGLPSAPRVYAISFLWAVGFFLINMRWLVFATVEGYAPLSVYLALFFPLMACPVRHAIRRRWPLVLVFPLIWTGNEFVRGVFVSGFPWFFLSHSQARFLSLIQISDIVGSYGVSFVVAAVNGAIADALFHRLRCAEPFFQCVGQARLSVGVAVGLVVGAIGYGRWQLSAGTSSPGPKVAVVQGDFLSLVKGDDVEDLTKKRIYFEMLEAASAHDPDWYLLPETPWIMYLNPEARGMRKFWNESFTALQSFATRRGALLVTGSASLEQHPTDLLARERRFNSATVFSPDGSEPGRYDKVHVVPFGEAVPFRFGRLRFLYFWFNSYMPFSGADGKQEFSVFPGTEFRVFRAEARSLGGREFRFGIPICYEDVMPYVSREFVSGGQKEKRADFLLNISNDGWFGRGIQQPQHFAICVFRAVENRVGIARAVNTGVSGFIDPDGRSHDLVRGDSSNRWPGSCGYTVAALKADSRYPLYSRYGDWFAWTCVGAWFLLFGDYWLTRVRGRGE